MLCPYVPLVEKTPKVTTSQEKVIVMQSKPRGYTSNCNIDSRIHWIYLLDQF